MRFKPHILQEYFNVMLYRDLVERYDIRDVSVLKYLIKRLIGSFTKEFSIHKLYNELKSRGFAISKDTLYRLMDSIFQSTWSLPSKNTIRRSQKAMSNRKIYLYDNGFASAIQFAFSEDRGKLLENLVFSALRKKSDELFFVKNGGECDFVSFQRGLPPLLVQVTEQLNDENYDRELRGLNKARSRIEKATGLILWQTTPPGRHHCLNG